MTPVVRPGTQRLQPIWVDDVARAIGLAAASEADGLVEIGGPEVIDWERPLDCDQERARARTRPALHVPGLR